MYGAVYGIFLYVRLLIQHMHMYFINGKNWRKKSN
jgi:hypothetical protein